MSLSTPIPSIFSTTLRLVYPQQRFNYKDSIPLRLGCLWKIEQGVVRSLTRDDDGRILTLGFWGRGDVVGQPLSRIKPYQIVCLTSVQATQLSLNNDSLQEILAHVWKSEEFLSILHQHSIYTRLLHLFEWLSHHFGERVEGGILLNFRLTHQSIAESIGTSRVTVTRLVKQLEEEGIILRSRKHLILTTP